MKFYTSITTGLLISILPVWSAPGLADDAVTDAMKTAQAEYESANAVGHVWRVIDKSTGSKSVAISKLLKQAQKEYEAGNTEEALRIANVVRDSALLGQAQAKDQANAAPVY